MARLRIAYARIAQETNALSPVRTELADFERTHLFAGAELHANCQKGGYEAPGFLKNAELSGFIRAVEAEGGVEAVPLFSAWAVPNGPLSAECFATLRDRLVAELEAAGPVDALFLVLHGAMNADGQAEPEAALVAAARTVLGDKPVAVTMDLHANLSREKVAAMDLICAYRTNPHRDHAKVGERCGRILIRQLKGQVRPTRAWRSLPLILGGGTTVDFLPTMRPLFRRMKQLEKDPRVLYCSLFMVHLWNDSPEIGWSTHVITDDAPELAEQLAEELADLAWGVRDVMPPEFPGPAEALAKVRRARLARAIGTVTLCDASDVVGTGAAGESPHLVKALLEATDLVSYAPIRDAGVIDQIWGTPEGERVQVTLAGKLDPARNPPLPVEGTLLRKLPTEPFGRVAVLDLGALKLVVTEGQPLAMKPAFYKDVGLDPMKADAVVVKSLFPFLLYFLPYHRRAVYVRTQGVSDFDAARELSFLDPVHPFDPVTAWRPIDRMRRGLVPRPAA
ncbi:MAG: M81 family metallopeptidase [Myxococcales bacterium]|nr:M81 family metallopeptidase [Myxococcales bacterium]MCB9526529.1 M81 family metallopeptidase [Myxococcales bacterium]